MAPQFLQQKKQSTHANNKLELNFLGRNLTLQKQVSFTRIHSSGEALNTLNANVGLYT